MVQTVVQAGAAQGFLVAARRWTVPVYYADATTPKVSVAMTASWAPATTMTGVPMPANAAPDPSTDGHMAVLDKSTGCEYDFWKATRSSTGAWSAGWGNSLMASGTGVYPNGLSARGSGFGLGAGLVSKPELTAGAINHALVFSFPTTKAGGPVLPATESDGQSSAAGAIPEGAHLQLDPSLDLSTFGLLGWQLTIARTLQRYGMILGDSGGGVSLYAENASTAGAYPWGAVDYAYLPTSLLSHLRVLTTGPQYKPSFAIAPTSCSTLR
jgi:hypothetical protein